VENALDVIVHLSPQYHIVSLNRAFESATGFKRKDWLGKPFEELVYTHDWDKVVKTFRGILEEKTSPLLELRIHSNTSDLLHGELTAVAMYTRQRATAGILCILRDVTLRKRLQSQFVQAQKMEAVGLLASGVAHDFNNILTGIIGNTQLALDRVGNVRAAAEALQQILALGDRGSKITRQLLSLTRDESSEPQAVQANAMLSESLDMLRPLLGGGVRVRQVFRAQEDTISIDPAQFEQMILNLAVNAKEAMPKGGTLTIETSNLHLKEQDCTLRPGLTPGPHVALAFSDTGLGMDENIRRRVFEPFFTTKRGKGTGLGLSTVHAVVRRHRGHISVYSEPRLGTTFQILLPVAQNNPRPGTANQAEEDCLATGSETILLVEDEEALRRMIERVLTKLGYKVHSASGLEDAHRLFAQWSDEVALVLTDVVMPDGYGHTMFESMRATRPQLKALLMSGYTDNALSSLEGIPSDIPFIQKPFRPSELVHKVRELLES
jgi:PAS domain S-box-containing protein